MSDGLAIPQDRAAAPAWLKAAGLMLLFPFLTFLTSQTHWFPWLAVPMPPFGVPQTLQTLFVVLAAMAIGPKLATVSFLGFLVVGALGVPIFADGNAGLATILGQTGGYLVGFVACQPVVGLIVRDRAGHVRGFGAIALASLAGHAVVFAIGVPWLWTVHQIDDLGTTIAQALHGGFVVFIPGMLAKTLMAVILGLMFVPGTRRRAW